jgi:hypothetical protein
MNPIRWNRQAWWMVALLVCASPAAAQFGAPRVADPATGEKYHFEVSGVLWKPAPEGVISSEGLGVPGTDIDFVSDLGFLTTRFSEIRMVLRPARKHKFRADYVPVKYTADATLQRTIVFNGIAYTVGIPLSSELKWETWNLFYEYDFVYRDRGFAGLLVGAKYTTVEATISSPIETGFSRARGPIPAVGGIGRVYVMPNISITGQVTFFDMPDNVSDRFKGDLYDVDVYGTLNFTNNVGVQAGYRSVDVEYLADRDAGKIKVDGWYVGGVVRF